MGESESNEGKKGKLTVQIQQHWNVIVVYKKKEKKKKENHILIWGKDLSPLSISRVSFLFILFFFWSTVNHKHVLFFSALLPQTALGVEIAKQQWGVLQTP